MEENEKKENKLYIKSVINVFMCFICGMQRGTHLNCRYFNDFAHSI